LATVSLPTDVPLAVPALRSIVTAALAAE